LKFSYTFDIELINFGGYGHENFIVVLVSMPWSTFLIQSKELVESSYIMCKLIFLFMKKELKKDDC
jgi:hypothetical protein